jgi:hypothetical protein
VRPRSCARVSGGSRDVLGVSSSPDPALLVGSGAPQPTHALARSLIIRPHSWQLTNAMCFAIADA